MHSCCCIHHRYLIVTSQDPGFPCARCCHYTGHPIFFFTSLFPFDCLKEYMNYLDISHQNACGENRALLQKRGMCFRRNMKAFEANFTRRLFPGEQRRRGIWRESLTTCENLYKLVMIYGDGDYHDHNNKHQ